MEIETRELTTDQDEHTTQQDESDLSPTDELFSMADNVREDGLYDVEILDWEKEGGSKTQGELVTVHFDTKFDGTHSNTFTWPNNPTEENEFVSLLMQALGVDDPVKAVSRADALKSPDGDEIGTTVPAERSDSTPSSWNIDTSVNSNNNDSVEKPPLGTMLFLFGGGFAFSVLLLPIMILDLVNGKTLSENNREATERIIITIGAATGMFFYGAFLAVIL